jgi:hypothetical protein
LSHLLGEMTLRRSDPRTFPLKPILDGAAHALAGAEAAKAPHTDFPFEYPFPRSFRGRRPGFCTKIGLVFLCNPWNPWRFCFWPDRRVPVLAKEQWLGLSLGIEETDLSLARGAPYLCWEQI